MDSQHFEYWQPQQQQQQQDAYAQPPPTYYEYTPDLASIPSLSASPTSTATYDASTPTPGPQSMQHHHQAPQQIYHSQAPSYSTYAYQIPVTPSDFGSADEGANAAGTLPSPPYVCSPRQSSGDIGYPLSPETATFPLQIVNEQGFGQSHVPVRSASNGSTWSSGTGSGGVQSERTHVTSGRRRAQNRAAQRAFRERKEKHAKDLENQLALLSEKYGKLEASHVELNTAYEKLRRTIELLTSPDDDDADAMGEIEGLEGVIDAHMLARGLKRREGLGRDKETLRKLVEILHGEVGRRPGSVKCEA